MPPSRVTSGPLQTSFGVSAPDSARTRQPIADNTAKAGKRGLMEDGCILPTRGSSVGYSLLNGKRRTMKAADFRRIALSLEGAEEGSHMGSADFRVGGRIFATLASQKQGYGNLMLTPEQQVEFVADQPEVFVPIAGG